jgi:hypothetical protein
MQTSNVAHPLLPASTSDDQPAPDRKKARSRREPIDWRQPLAIVLLVLAALAFLVGWYGIANTNQEWEQLPYLASAGGLGVLALAAGLALFVSMEHSRDRDAIGELVDEVRGLHTRMAALEATLTGSGLNESTPR